MTLLARWEARGVPVAVEYDPEVLDYVRSLAVDGFQRLARGGLEIGGILFGAHEDNEVQVLAARPVSCSYATGPSFVLSEADRLNFITTLNSYRGDAELENLAPVGWFVSHCRSELVMSAGDREIFADYFPEPWQLTLVLRPGRMGGARAGFFVRNAQGRVPEGASPLEFNVEPVRAPAPPKPVATTTTHAAAATAPARVQARPAVVPVPDFSFSMATAAPRRRRRWGWIVAWVAAIAAISGGWFYVNRPVPQEPIALQAKEDDGQTRLEWNPAAPAVAGATRAELVIADGDQQRTIQLTRAQLSRGAYVFLRRHPDVNFQLNLYGESGPPQQEVTRYLGQAVPEAQGQPESKSSALDALRQDKRELTNELTAAKARNQQLEKRVSTLEDLLRIERNRTEVFRSQAK